MTDPRPLCVIGEQAHTSHVGYLCRSHLERMGSMLRDIEDQAALLSAVPSFQQRSGSRGGSPAFTRAPVRLDAVAMRDPRSRLAGVRPAGPACHTCWHDSCTDIRTWVDAYDAQATEILSILDVLHSWARVVREDRDLSVPEAVTVSSERAVLTRHLEFVAAQPWVDEAYGDVRELVGQLRAANGTGPDRPYSRCPVIHEGHPCTGQVWIHDELQPVWRRYVDRCSQSWEQAPGSAVCDTCGSSWKTDAEKARLRRMIDGVESVRPQGSDGRPMLTAVEIAQQMGTTVNAVYLRLSRAKIRAVNGYYDPAALRADVAS